MAFLCAFQGFSFYLEIVYPTSIRIFSNRCQALLKFYLFYGGQHTLVNSNLLYLVNGLSNLLLETKVFCVDGPLTLVHFIDWVGS